MSWLVLSSAGIAKHQRQAYLEDGSEVGKVDGLELAAMVGLELGSIVGLLKHRWRKWIKEEIFFWWGDAGFGFDSKKGPDDELHEHVSLTSPKDQK